MLAGIEPRPSNATQVNDRRSHPQRRHLGLSDDNHPTQHTKVVSNNSSSNNSSTSFSNPNQSMEPPHGDRSYQRNQVEKLGYRYHQSQYASRGSGANRSAATDNDLRSLLANVNNQHSAQTHKFSKKMFPHDSNERSSASKDYLRTSNARFAVQPAVLNSAGVAAAFTTYQPAAAPETQPTGAAGATGATSGQQQTWDSTNIQQCPATEVNEASVTATPRVQPSMVSTLPIGWEKGSSWNNKSENRFETSSQRQNTGKVVAKHSTLDHRNRRLGRNRSVLRSQIVFG